MARSGWRYQFRPELLALDRDDGIAMRPLRRLMSRLDEDLNPTEEMLAGGEEEEAPARGATTRAVRTSPRS